MDNPGLVTQACGNVLDKWDGVWRQKEADLTASYTVPGSQGAVLSNIEPCRKPKPSAGECFDHQVEFIVILNLSFHCSFDIEVVLRHN